jgi:two-component system, cell cycle response regulator
MNAAMSGGNRVVIAEDDNISQRILESFLTKWGYEVLVTSNGSEAWKILNSDDAPRLAVLDWMMPGLEGIQVCRNVRARIDRPYVYILLLTARGLKQDLIEAMNAGADDYLTKPFDAEELRARVHVGQRIIQLQDDLIAARDELRFQATHDALTNLVNRGVVLEVLLRETARQKREGGALAVMLCDLDHFKSVNDRYGHQAGDAVLEEVARRLANTVRVYDTVGRYGGEEFLIVLPALDGVDALNLAERLRHTLESHPIPIPGGSLTVTVSLGVAASSAQFPFEAPTLLHAADTALYRAKENGRNRSEIATVMDYAGVNSTGVGQLTPVRTR